MYQMEKILLFLSYLSLTKSSELSCIQCSSTRENQALGHWPCSEFDWSSKYIVQCPKSTFCFKRTFTVPLGNEIHSIEKGCAPQRLNTQRLDRTNRKWYPTEEIVKSIYEEGCSKAEDNGRPGPPAEYCYCSSWLCNGSSSLRNVTFNLIILQLTAILFCIWQRS